jgi:haloalkane dehalogenase
MTSWLDRDDYPFRSNYHPTPIGRMHYVDEGKGDPMVFVHGNPSWSYEFRNMIKELSKTNRCIAPDLIGFGLSDKPLDWSYLPIEHARLLEDLLLSLDLRDITLIVGDWGGPIGLSFAINHPERVKNLVVNNTWCWSVKKDWYYQAFSGFMGGPLGRFLIKRFNFFAKGFLPSVFGDKKKLTKETHRHYYMHLANPKERKGNWTFPKQIVGSSEWLGTLWDRIGVLKDKKVLIAWGMKDIAFRKKELDRWIGVFPEARVVRYPDAGHFVAEERPDDLSTEIRQL